MHFSGECYPQGPGCSHLSLPPYRGKLQGWQYWPGAHQNQDNPGERGWPEEFPCTCLTVSKVRSLGSSWPPIQLLSSNTKCLGNVCQIASTSSIHALVLEAPASGLPLSAQ